MSLKTIRPRIAAIDTRAARTPPKTTNAFYFTPEWRGLMAEIIAERGRICEDTQCQKGGPHVVHGRVFGDHIVELQDGGAPLDKRNVMLRCGSAHTTKTAQARAARQTTR